MFIYSGMRKWADCCIFMLKKGDICGIIVQNKAVIRHEVTITRLKYLKENIMEELHEYKCPCCGGAIAFDSSLQKLKCPYCETEFDIEDFKAYGEAVDCDTDDDMGWDDSSSEWADNDADGVVEYVCNSCGGVIMADVNTAATACPYCGNPVVMTGKVSGTLRPDCIIPFKLNKEDAKKAYFKHLTGKKLLPDVFKDENHIDEIRGVYVPFWLFDSDVDADIRYRGTKVRTWSDSSYNYTETSYFSVFRKGTLDFENVPVDGSSKMADDLMESVEPFNASEAVDFQTAYLAGYLADKYDVSRDESIGRANKRIRKSTEDCFQSTARGYATLRTEHSNIGINGRRTRYALYPVWLLNTTWRGNKYTFAMNGQTGKMVGNLPMDKGAYWKWWGLYAGIVSAVAFGIISLISLL